MTGTTTPGSDTENSEDQKQVSDARVILGPLVKYAAVGFVIVTIIVTTSVMLDRQFNTIDEEVAKLEAQLEQANQPPEIEAADRSEADVTEDQVAAETTPESQPKTAIKLDVQTAQPVQLEPDVAVTPASEAFSPDSVIAAPVVSPPASQTGEQAAPTETTADTNAAVADTRAKWPYQVPYYFNQSREKMIAERNAYIREMDRIYMEQYRASQQKQLQLMRERLARQQRRIEERQKRYQKFYDTRDANLKALQQTRDSSSADRI